MTKENFDTYFGWGFDVVFDGFMWAIAMVIGSVIVPFTYHQNVSTAWHQLSTFEVVIFLDTLVICLALSLFVTVLRDAINWAMGHEYVRKTA